ncbi:MAG: L-threonine 3-dehydrogenase [Tenericutes bacterium GWD2_38_27]|nr:MAG: L-threonine 3-dehydrogenase [Tenericutes bacterium GWD2_38_27]OHE40615.1 MAG: L-threonine 3-dehydrogenase [Tenericutes bacterium GWF2_38_8]HCB66147.1 L-threonine 3-dehydrogenase [Acholeplasmataceae bacterium]
MEMTAIIKETRAAGLKIVKKQVPDQLKPDEVLVKVIVTSICGTDVHIYKWDKWSQGRIKPPLTTGHEFCGKVIKIGSKVTKVKVGDVVSAETHIVCGECEFCKRGEYHICKNTKIIGVDTDGCFAEYAKMPAYNLIVNNSGIDPKFLSIQEPLGNAVHTMLHFDIKDKTVAVVGCGPIGLMGVNIAKAVGAKKIIAIEVNDYRIKLAKELGADVVINPLKEDVIQRVFEETDGTGIDVVTEFSGNKQAIEQAFKYVKPGGKMSMLGIVPSNIEIDLSNDVVFKGITIYGVVGRLLFKTWDQVTELVQSGKLNLDKIITHTLPLKDIEKGMEIMISGNSGKVVLIP